MHFCNCLGINIIVNSIRKLIYGIAKAHLWRFKIILKIQLIENKEVTLLV